MHVFIAKVIRFVTETEGQDLVEYGLLAALIAVVAISGVSFLGNTVVLVLWEPLASAI